MTPSMLMRMRTKIDTSSRRKILRCLFLGVSFSWTAITPTWPECRPLYFSILTTYSRPTRSTPHARVAAFKSGFLEQFAELWANVFHENLRQNLRTLHDVFLRKLVFSSTWATYLSLAKISEVLVRSGLDCFAGALYVNWRSVMDVGSFRATELRPWLKRNGPTSRFAYLILDDTVIGYTVHGMARLRSRMWCFVMNSKGLANSVLSRRS
jgi:hypothetical protein